MYLYILFTKNKGCIVCRASNTDMLYRKGVVVFKRNKKLYAQEKHPAIFTEQSIFLIIEKNTLTYFPFQYAGRPARRACGIYLAKISVKYIYTKKTSR